MYICTYTMYIHNPQSYRRMRTYIPYVHNDSGRLAFILRISARLMKMQQISKRTRNNLPECNHEPPHRPKMRACAVTSADHMPTNERYLESIRGTRLNPLCTSWFHFEPAEPPPTTLLWWPCGDEIPSTTRTIFSARVLCNCARETHSFGG